MYLSMRFSHFGTWFSSNGLLEDVKPRYILGSETLSSQQTGKETRKRPTTRFKQLITTSQQCPRCGQYTGGEGFPTSRPAKAKHPQVHLSGPKGFRYIGSEEIAFPRYSSNIFGAMRSSINNLCFCALAASSTVKAQDAYAQRPGDADLLSDINVISRYWGTFAQFFVHHLQHH